MIVDTHEGFEVRARRRLDAPGAFRKMLGELAQALEDREDNTPQIADLDVSQNKLTLHEFRALFRELIATNTRVLRFRLSGCPTLNDDVARVLGAYVSTRAKETAPTEMHLSDCAITTEGFVTFISTFEATDVYPLPSRRNRKAALCLRLENNYISEAAIQEKVNLGVIKIKSSQKAKGGKPNDGTTKIDLIVRGRGIGKYQQNLGEPPAPDPRPVVIMCGGRSCSAADRSRSPSGSTRPRDPWQRHFSHKHGIHYWWNSQTDESRWERPSA